MREPEAPDRDIPVEGRRVDGYDAVARQHGGGRQAQRRAAIAADGSPRRAGRGGREQAAARLARASRQAAVVPAVVGGGARPRRRLPDPVRTAAVRAVLIIAVTLMQAMVAFLSHAGRILAGVPDGASAAWSSTVVATWGALDVWVTRQVWNQRNGVVSTPSSTARALRRERRRARRQARAAGARAEPEYGGGRGRAAVAYVGASR